MADIFVSEIFPRSYQINDKSQMAEVRQVKFNKSSRRDWNPCKTSKFIFKNIFIHYSIIYYFSF